MRNTIILILFAVSLVFAAVQKGDPAPDFKLHCFGKKKEYKLSDYKGKVIVLTWFSPFCVYCRQEIKWLDKLALDYKKSNVVFFLLYYNSRQSVKPFQEKCKNLVFLDDSNNVAWKSYVFNKFLPVNYIINKEGKVSLRTNSISQKEMKQTIDELK
ncbi:MAG: redoxin domain-containing protein [Candidatus Coatesbacteria bacterium]|nr:redoxin domain-containing protein [Candidatus Coatesbacteria bacterium]